MTRRKAKAPSQRQLRVGEELRHALARILGRGIFSDPVLAEASITVTEVRISPDLKNATVFVMTLGGRDLGAIVRALNHAAGFVRNQMAEEVTLRYLPRLGFQPDVTFDQAERIAEILTHPKVAHDLERPEAEAPSPDPALSDEEAEGGA